MENNQVLIIGGGLAGLTAAIHLSSVGMNVTVVEKNSYPKHKVCGEYISNEVLPYLKSLNISISELHPTRINKLTFSTAAGKSITAPLPLGGFGISRYALDEYLYKKAVANGTKVIHESVETIAFDNDAFTITTSSGKILEATVVFGAFGKRSNIDQKMQRTFIQQKSPWLAVKAHYKGNFPNDLVGLHNFKGGYCGVSKVENNVVNVCYLADYETFKNYKNIEEYQDKVVSANPNLKAVFSNMTLLFDKPLTISQVSFEKKEAVENHMLMIGDTAGLIHPLCGNGMAMAIHSAKIAAELVEAYCNKQLTRKQLEENYTTQWNYNFKKRLKTGRMLSALLQKPKLSNVVLRIFTALPFLLPIIINKTHGKPITLQS
ncbi:NAD(P)/FAD-dependent oxidoreductase [Flavobacterium sp.]|uniref:NAD(P)/FAD-dependent oxidoreductase n=1 Tax=Flavobacterium sp. TaxID=239 RepID=UPI002489D6CF|nr:NAD(P)/FAD-dependent oxidoreductase [Flavobacterium sp.]MDI1316028.1 NAD(P)/FAD-dependent oxidoreductase [Flavobacterium sp.]